MQIKLKIHSFIDIITNSSTEIFVAATQHTIENVKKLVDALLAVGGSTLTADHLFEFKLVNSSYHGRVSDWEYDIKYYREKAEEEGREFDLESFIYDNPKPDPDEERSDDEVDLLVTLRPGVNETPEIKAAIEVMTRLSGLFSVGEKYN